MRAGTHHARIQTLDGVRGMAILMVILLHGHMLDGGQIGVDIFFVLSGFLISCILMREAEASQTISIANFYMRRALRLGPALVLFVGCYLFIVAAKHPASLQTAYTDAASVLLYIHNLRILDQGSENLTMLQWMISHCWSLSVEEQFYLLWPWLLFAATRLRRSNMLILATILAGIVWPALGRAFLYNGGYGLELYFRTDLRFDGLMWGALVAWLTVNGHVPAQRYAPYVIAAAVSGLAFLLWFSTVKTHAMHYHYGYTLVGVATGSLIAALVWFRCAPLERLFGMAWLRWFGTISYGLYLAHVPVFVLMGRKIDTIWDAAAHTLTAGAVSVALAALSFYLMEVPFLRMKQRFASPHEPAVRLHPIPAVTRPA